MFCNLLTKVHFLLPCLSPCRSYFEKVRTLGLSWIRYLKHIVCQQSTMFFEYPVQPHKTVPLYGSQPPPHTHPTHPHKCSWWFGFILDVRLHNSAQVALIDELQPPVWNFFSSLYPSRLLFPLFPALISTSAPLQLIYQCAIQPREWEIVLSVGPGHTPTPHLKQRMVCIHSLFISQPSAMWSQTFLLWWI